MTQATPGRRLFGSGSRYHARMRRPSSVLPCSLPLAFASTLLALAGSLVGCGEEAPPDREQVMRVYERAMRALHAADWDALQRELTKDARNGLERDLTRFSRRLGHPEDGKLEREIARARLGAGADEALRRASEGGLAEALAFFLRISPRAEVPPTRGFKLDTFQAKFLYALADGTFRPVALVRLPDGWYVSNLQL
jgi:hypothetical protein